MIQLHIGLQRVLLDILCQESRGCPPALQIANQRGLCHSQCTPHLLHACRECFLDILCQESGEFLVEEAAEAKVPTWEESKKAWRDVPIALMHLRRSIGGETVGVKLLRRE